jgi:hypothetical protein
VATKDLTRSFGWDAYDSFMQHDVQAGGLRRGLSEGAFQGGTQGCIQEGRGVCPEGVHGDFEGVQCGGPLHSCCGYLTPIRRDWGCTFCRDRGCTFKLLLFPVSFQTQQVPVFN